MEPFADRFTHYVDRRAQLNARMAHHAAASQCAAGIANGLSHLYGTEGTSRIGDLLSWHSRHIFCLGHEWPLILM
jgi:hypothetical protein